MAKIMHVRSHSATETVDVGRCIGVVAKASDVVLFFADLGTGKTTLSQGIALGLGITEPIKSPTFTLMQTYQGRLPLMHFDAYRLEQEDEAMDIGLEEAMEAEGLCLLEWAERLPGLWPEAYLSIKMDRVDETTRDLCFAAQGREGEEFLQRLAQAWERAGIEYECTEH